MALLNDKHNFIFFHLYKCGGTSIREHINGKIPNTYELQGGHSLPIDMKFKMEKEGKLDLYEDMFKFTFVRNPYDFVLSTLFYAKRFANHFMHNDVKDFSVEQFIPYYMGFRNKHHNDREKLRGTNRVVTIKDWLLDENGEFLVDYIGKTETIKSDLDVIHDRIGLSNVFEVPHKNINPMRVADYRQYYNENAKKLIQKHFGWELDYFKYTF